MTKTDWPKPMPVVEVYWLDSATGSGWRRQQEWDEDFDTQAIECRSVGYLWKKTRKEVALMQSVNEEGQLCSVIVIPRFAVTHMTVLRARGTNWDKEPVH